MPINPRKVINTRKWWKKYEYRIEQYCKIECSQCRIDRRTGEAFCWGKFTELRTGKGYHSAGIECDKVINFCFDENIRKDER